MRTPTRPRARRASPRRSPPRARRSSPRCASPPRSRRASPRRASPPRARRLFPEMASTARSPSSPPREGGIFLPRPLRLAALDRWRRSRERKQYAFIPRALRLAMQNKKFPASHTPHSSMCSYNREQASATMHHDQRTFFPRALRLASICSASHDVYRPEHSRTAHQYAFIPRALRLAMQNKKFPTSHTPHSSMCSYNREQASATMHHDQRTFVPRALRLASICSASRDVHRPEHSRTEHQAVSVPCLPDQPPSVPQDIINLMCSMVSLKDVTRMRLCCRDWLENMTKIFTAEYPMLFSFADDRMLFFRPKDQLFFFFFEKRPKDQLVLAINHSFVLPEINFYSSLSCLVTIVGMDSEILVLNLKSLTLTALPSLARHFDDVLQATSWQYEGNQFRTLVVSSDLGQMNISIYYSTHGWNTRFCRCEGLFHPSEKSAPVIVNSTAYILGRHCRIGVYDLESQTWTVLPMKLSWTIFSHQECYLLAVESDLVAVVTDTGHLCPPIVLKVNMDRYGWDQVSTLGGFSLFTGLPSSLAVQDPSPREFVTLPSLSGQYSTTEAEIKWQEGHMLFVVESHIPIQASVYFTCWPLNQQGVRGFPWREKRRCQFSKEVLLGTWVSVKANPYIEDMMEAFIGPSQKPA
ncbi:hypothetical protein ACQJBY_037285 [Aegilops geniculata]